MKDPCLECLVRVTCWQECDDKRNFTTLLSTAIKNYRGQIRINKTYQKQFQTLMKKSAEHIVRQSEINSRALLMSKKD